ncbi:MAG: hypothetical protein F2924_01975 [Actinobacteria bacterium]|uniref:Unannotated protein n=1 Tax=freshwater metagenome TaxID=449393 RepID=A0A6J7SKH2_9ZZZZ|nr:hypothetical protein [Actinomycetota bacterium]
MITLTHATQRIQTLHDTFWNARELQAVSIDITIVKSSAGKHEGFTLTASRTGNRITATVGVERDHAYRYALNALTAWIDTGEATITMNQAPDFPIRGVVEGFYGKPWSHEQRVRALKYCGDYNMNTYFLAPKDIPWQRFNWRSLFDETFLAHTQELIEVGHKNAIELAVCVSPGLSVKYSDEADVDAVVNRYKQLFDLGARHFGLLWDDIAWELQHDEDIKRYVSTAAAHADFTNRVWSKLVALDPHIVLTMCPMHYSGRGNEPYLQVLGQELHARVNIMWTGRSIISEYLDISDAVIFERTTLRPALYWDNFPVNDGGLQKNLYIGPVRGREAGLHKYSSGLVSNPMLQFEMSQIPLYTIGDYLWDTTNYNPDLSWENALKYLVQNEADRNALRKFLRTSMGTAVGGDPAPDLRQVFRKGVSQWRQGNLQEAGEVFIAAGEEIATNHAYLLKDGFSKPLMIAEIAQWLEKYLIGGEVLIGLGKVLQQCSFDTIRGCISGTQAHISALEALGERLQEHRKNLFGDQIEGPINELIAELRS